VNKLTAIGKNLEIPIQTISNILMLVILVLVFAEVISRYVFDESYGFMEAFSKWSQIWITYLMVGVVANRREHIAFDLIFQKLTPVYKHIFLLITDIAILAFCVLLFQSSIQTIQNWMLLGYKSAIEFDIPMWTIMLCTPVGAAFFALFSIKNMIIDIMLITNTIRRKADAYS
jgi:TRAP-type C4-dicarboxylate transport system permease small subunit